MPELVDPANWLDNITDFVRITLVKRGSPKPITAFGTALKMSPIDVVLVTTNPTILTRYVMKRMFKENG